MARRAKLEVSAINLRIPVDRPRDYAALINRIASLKAGVRVMGDTYLAISHFDPDSNDGIFSKYSEIDIDGDWFDIEDFAVAAPEKVSDLSIPDTLRPNYAGFRFHLDPAMHVITFESYAESKGLSSRSVEKYLKEVLRRSDVQEEFGHVEADVVKSYGEVEKILSLPALRELSLVIRRPNPDDLSGGLAAEIEERLREQNGEEYEERLKSKDGDGLNPNERTRKLAIVAAENGQVFGKSIVNGVLAEQSTLEKPLKEVETYNSEEVSSLTIFQRLSAAILEAIKRSRDTIRGGEAV